VLFASCIAIFAVLFGLLMVWMVQDVSPAPVLPQPAYQTPALKWVNDPDASSAVSVQGIHFGAREEVTLFLSPAYDAGFEKWSKLTDVTASANGDFVAQLDLSQKVNLPANGHIVARGRTSGFTSPLGPIKGISHTAAPAVIEPTTTPLPAAVPIPPTPLPPPLPDTDPSDRWYAEYFANRDLLGSPVITRNDSVIDFNWGQAQPVATMARDNFSVRWTRRAYFPETESYQFTLMVDDGVRVYLDDQPPIINDWRIGPRRSVKQSVSVTRGEHRVRVEYYTATGPASISLNWKPGYAAWEGRYYNSSDFTGDVVYKRDDGDANGLSFDWGGSAPAPGVSPDNFSAVWERTIVIKTPGEYKFNIEADDGARIYIDGAPLYDNLYAVGAFEAQRRLKAGRHFVQVQYVERGGDARFKLNWEQVAPAQ
jgi:hypothetical protein